MSSNELAPLKTSNAVAAIIPSDFDAVLEYASLVQASGLAPQSLQTKEKIAVAMMQGYELGMTPLMSLQSIAVVNNRTSLWGDAPLALCQTSGVMEDFHEEVTGEGDAMVATCTVKRKGRGKATVETFSVKDAIAAGLWGKQGPWKQYPKRMLKLRARAFALRDTFPDVLKGIAIAEEQQDIDVTPATRGGPPAPKGAVAPTATDAEFEEVRPAAAEAKPPKPRAAPAPKAAESKPEPAAEKEPYDEQAQAEASRREEIESAGQVYDGGEAEDRGDYDDGSTADPIDAGDVEDAVIEEEINDDIETNAPSLDSLIADLKALVSKSLPLAAYFSEMNSIAQKTATWDDFKALYAHRLPHNGDNAIKTGHVTITNAQKARLQPETGPAASGTHTGTADVTGLNKDIKGNVPWNGPTAYRSEMLSRIEAARAAWEAKKKPEMEQAIYDLADDIALKQESKVLGDAIAKELKGILEAIVEKF